MNLEIGTEAAQFPEKEYIRCSVTRNWIIFFVSEPQLPSSYHATLLQLFIILPLYKVSVDIFTVFQLI